MLPRGLFVTRLLLTHGLFVTRLLLVARLLHDGLLRRTLRWFAANGCRCAMGDCRADQHPIVPD